jgi:hypothetical protein
MEIQTQKPRRERPKPVKLTEAAALRLAAIMENAEGKYLGLRVGVTNGGCAGMSYTMEYASDAKPFEEVTSCRKNWARASSSTIRTRHRRAVAAKAFRSRRPRPTDHVALNVGGRF